MQYLAATIHTLGFRLGDRASSKLQSDPGRGSVTIENVLWAVASIAFVGIVVAVIKSYVTTQAGQIR
jgi:hypothetical protein